MIDENSLKPCQFCGSEIVIRWRENAGRECSECVECGARSVAILPDDDWNTRPIEDKLNARIQELEARVVELEARTRWHKTSEELPPENGVYLVIASFERIYPQPFCTGYEEAWRRLYERWAYMPESGDK